MAGIRHADQIVGPDHPAFQISKNAQNRDHVVDPGSIPASALTGGGAPPTGAAGGELAGSYPNPTVGYARSLIDGMGSAGNLALAYASNTDLGTWRIGANLEGHYGSLAIRGPSPWADLAAWLVVYDGVTDNSAPIQAAVNAFPASGGRIYSPPSTNAAVFATTIDVSGKRSIVFEGASGRSSGAATSSWLRYTGTGNAFNCQSTSGVIFRDLMITTSNGAFAGKVIDYRGLGAGDTAYGSVERCTIAATGTGECIALNKAIDMTVEKSLISGGAYGISGQDAGGYSNAIALRSVAFGGQTTAAIRDMAQSWEVGNCTFEPLVGGSVVAHAVTNGFQFGIDWHNNWHGDASVGSTQVTFSGVGISIRSNFFGGVAASSTAISIISLSDGVDIASNDFASFLNAVNFTGAVTNVTIPPNNHYDTVTNTISGTMPTTNAFLNTTLILDPGSGNTAFQTGQAGRPKKIGWNAASSPFDVLDISSMGSTGGWQGTIDLKVGYSAGTLRTAIRAVADTAGTGSLLGLYGVTAVARAAAIAAPTAPSAGYVQAEAQSMKTAVDAIRVALTNIGLTS